MKMEEYRRDLQIKSEHTDMEEYRRDLQIKSEHTDIDELIRHTANQSGDLSHMISTGPRYCSTAEAQNHNLSTHHLQQQQQQNHHDQFMNGSPISITAESLHQYHSMHSTPMHESSDDDHQYMIRRASDPTASIYARSGPSYPEEFRVWGEPEHSIAEPPAIDSGNVSTQWEDEWARHGTQHLSSMPQGSYPSPHLAQSPTTSYGGGDECGSSIIYIHQPPSPMMDGGDSFVLNGMIKSPSVPSPPESPGYNYPMPPSHLASPDYARTQAMTQWPGAYSQYEAHRRRASIPPTPPSRPPSTSNSSVLAAATLALASSSKHSSKVKSSSRTGSRRKTSGSAMRTPSKQHHLGHHHHHHHHSSASSHHVPGLEMEMSFVNFTPNDACRILSGVAPSGSSKTKARREREAQEKRRKLSEAAAAAVVAAGGDASALPKIDQL